MSLMLIVLQARLMEVERLSDMAIEKELTGKVAADAQNYPGIVGEASLRAWSLGVECGQAWKGKPEKRIKMNADIRGSIDGRLSAAFAEASGVLELRLAATGKNKKMIDRHYSEYVKKLKGTARAAMHDAANAGLIAGMK